MVSPDHLDPDALSSAWLQFTALADELPACPHRDALRLAADIANSLSNLRADMTCTIVALDEKKLTTIDAARELRRAKHRAAGGTMQAAANVAACNAAVSALQAAPATDFNAQADCLLNLFDLMGSRADRAAILVGRLARAYSVGVQCIIDARTRAAPDVSPHPQLRACPHRPVGR
jgi:hypothetical protein